MTTSTTTYMFQCCTYAATAAFAYWPAHVAGKRPMHMCQECMFTIAAVADGHVVSS